MVPLCTTDELHYATYKRGLVVLLRSKSCGLSEPLKAFLYSVLVEPFSTSSPKFMEIRRHRGLHSFRRASGMVGGGAEGGGLD